MQQDLAHLPLDFEIGEDDVLGCREVPSVAWRLLEVPGHLSRVGLDGNDRRDVEVVASAWRAQVAAPWRAIAGADVEQVEVGVVGHGVPHSAAAADFPILPTLRVGLPCRHCSLQMLALRRQARVTGHREKAPKLATGFGVVGRDVAADAKLAAAIADDHLVLDDARRARNGVGLVAIYRADVPDGLSGFCIKGHEPSVDRADIDPTLPDSNAAIDDVAAGFATPLARDFRIIDPQLLAGLGVERVDHTPRAGCEHHAVLDDGRCLEAANGIGVEAPGKAQVLDVVGIDLVEGREALLAIGATMGKPVSRIGISGLDPRAVNVGCLRQHLLHGLCLGDVGGLRPRDYVCDRCRRTAEASPQHGYCQDCANGGSNHPKTSILGSHYRFSSLQQFLVPSG